MIIRTGCEADNKEVGEILNSVIGQMSDGIWENSNLDRYWMFADATIVDDEWVLDISDDYGEWTGRNYQMNAFKRMTPAKILEFFARKIQQIAEIEIRDNGLTKSEAWHKESIVTTEYLNYHETITMGTVYSLRKHLLKVAKEVA